WCRDFRVAPSTDSYRSERRRRRVDGCQFRDRRYRDSARAAHRKGEASPASGGAVADRRGPGSATTELAFVRGPPLLLHGPAYVSILSEYVDARSRAYSTSAIRNMRRSYRARHRANSLTCFGRRATTN